MDHARNTIFLERVQNCNPGRVKYLRDTIVRDSTQKTSEEAIIKIGTFSTCTLALPPLSTFPNEFQQLYKDAIVDIDMKDDLQGSEVINWCRTAKPLYPLRTTADGNCLLHAVSQYLWGIEDNDQFLRRMLYLNIATDPKGAFKRRWLSNQRNSPDLQQFDVRLNTEEFTMEWDNVLKATADIARAGNHGLPYTALESIHLYILANMLQRAIIVIADSLARNVYGQTMQDCHIGGIYLPLESPPGDCCKSPILIGYNMNHFAPLLFEENGRNRQTQNLEQVIPIVTKDLNSLAIQYLLPCEEHLCVKYIQEYLSLSEVVYTGSDGFVSIAVAKVVHSSLPDDLNVMEGYRIDCERKFREIMDVEVGYIPNDNRDRNEQYVPPFNFQTSERHQNIPHYDQPRMNIRPDPPAGKNVVEREPMIEDVPRYINERRQCVTVGCKMFGNPEMSDLCSKCFKDFTIQYNRQEQAAKRTQRPPRQQAEVNDQYHDLSMMGEDCHGGCGFKCSTETYPYCHECTPNKVGGQHIPQAQRIPDREAYQPSIMADTCKGKDCSYKCSKATFPYCHQCYNKLNSQPLVAAPTAPPPPYPTDIGVASQARSGVDPNLMLRIGAQSKDETALLNIQPGQRMISNYRLPQESQRVANTPTAHQGTEPMAIQGFSGERSSKCKTQGCQNNAIKGNNGSCDTCYHNSLFGPGDNASSSPPDEQMQKVIENLENVCATSKCFSPVSGGTPHCLECFLKNGKFPDVTNRVGVESGAQAVAMNISPVCGPNEKVLNTFGVNGSMNIAGPPLTRSIQVVPAQHDEGINDEPVYSCRTAMRPQVENHVINQSESDVHRKYICSTPGCTGIRIDNPDGLCYNCLKPQQKRLVGDENRKSNNLEESAPFFSGSPVVLSEAEIKILNPVVVSSKQKQQCVSPSCETMIYPPKKLCDDCTATLQKASAMKSMEKNKSVPESIGPCKTQGCQFFGSAKFGGYCSSCHKSNVPPKRNTAPLAATNHLLENVNKKTRHTAPLVNSGKSSGQHCIEINCPRFGDPQQGNRCFQHFREAQASFPQLSPESIENLNLPVSPVNMANQNVAGAVFAGSHSKNRIPVESANQNRAQTVTPYVVAMSKVESSRKSTNLCKNSTTIGCKNYGNVQKNGFCNTCFPEVQRQEIQRRKYMATQSQQNKFGC